MVDANVLRHRLQKLSEYLDILRTTQQYSRSEFVEDPHLYGSAERFLQLSIEAINDMASHVVVDENLGAVERARDLPDIFKSEGLIGEEMREQWTDIWNALVVARRRKTVRLRVGTGRSPSPKPQTVPHVSA